jgi:hypothetical protein
MCERSLVVGSESVVDFGTGRGDDAGIGWLFLGQEVV